MMLSSRHVNPPLKALLRAFMRINDAAVAEVPLRGPLILATNHINWLDAPVGFSHLHPRPLTAFAKIETWDNFLLRTLFNAWEAIPITRGQVDFAAFKKAEEALSGVKIIAIAPEGTRSRTGRLNQGYPGIVYLALRTGVPILPFVFYGNENFSRDIRRYQRTEMNMRAGKPFRLVPPTSSLDRHTRQELTNAIMYEIASLLPEKYRGQYSQTGEAHHRHLEFIDLPV
jgi:1-acyl-sn-glycerol-3-phosphate acyltransferase